MIRKNHNHTLQTNPRHHEKEPENTNSHKTLGRQLKQLSRPDLDDCKTRKDAKKCITKQITTQDHSNSFEVHKTMNQQQGGGGGCVPEFRRTPCPLLWFQRIERRAAALKHHVMIQINHSIKTSTANSWTFSCIKLHTR